MGGADMTMPGQPPGTAAGTPLRVAPQPEAGPDLVLRFEGISKTFFGIRALNDVTFSIPRGHVLGLIGENGAGKSTLMNILGGVVKPDSGRIIVNGVDQVPNDPREASKAGIGFIHQELNLFTNLTVAENMFIAGFPRIAGILPLIDGRHIRMAARKALQAVDLQISPDTSVQSLTPGERQLVEIAKAILTDASLIIFDEPTTSLTARETERLFTLIERLQAEGRSIIYISHILGDVRRLCDEVVVLRDGAVVATGAIEEFPISRMITAMVGRDLKQLYPERTTKPTDEVALQVRGLSQPGVIAGIDLTLYRGEVLGLFGLMGSGRTELARILFGLDPYERGEMVVNGAPHTAPQPTQSIKRGIAFVTENRREEGLLMDGTIAANLALVALPRFGQSLLRFVNEGRLTSTAEEAARALQVKSGPITRHLVSSLSGGNQQKVVIGKWLMNKGSVFILDEPTRGVDVGAKFEIHNIINDLAAEGAAVLVISSELEELVGICDRILVMAYGEIRGEFQRDEFVQEEILRTAFREHKTA